MDNKGNAGRTAGNQSGRLQKQRNGGGIDQVAEKNNQNCFALFFMFLYPTCPL